GNITAGGADAAVDITSGGPLNAAGVIAAGAGAAGKAGVNLATTGGKGASIALGKDGVLQASGGTAALSLKAGGQNVDSGNAAAAILDGMLVVDAVDGPATLLVEAATASVSGFAVTS